MENITEKYKSEFERLSQSRSGEPSWLLRLRGEAMDAFAQKGFPTMKDEAWRYTDITSLKEASWALGEAVSQPSQKSWEDLKRRSGRNFLLIMNGKWMREHSSVGTGFEVSALPESTVLAEQHLGRHVLAADSAFSALNTGLFTQGLLIRIPEGATVLEPIHLVFLAAPLQGQNVFQTRTLVIAGKNSKATVVETYLSEANERYFTNGVAEIVLEEGARLEHLKVQNESSNAFHVALAQVVQRRGSDFVSFALSVGAKLMRNDCRVALKDENVACELNGLFLGDGEQVLDHQTFVDHQRPDGKSDQFFKGLLAGNSRGVFRGRVIVREDAQHTDAHQTNKNLLLSEHAKVDTQPQLEILADDVKCSHGAAVGQLQEDGLFYLRSRGIGEKEAGRILAQGFAREVIERSSLSCMKEMLLEQVDQKLTRQLWGEKE